MINLIFAMIASVKVTHYNNNIAFIRPISSDNKVNIKESGFDHRFGNVTDIEMEDFNYKAEINFRKLFLLKKLLNEEESNFNKLYLIEKAEREGIINESIIQNIFNGGLLDDWEFDI